MWTYSTGTFDGICVPKGFTVYTIEQDAKGRQGTKTLVFDDDQAQDETDDMMGLRGDGEGGQARLHGDVSGRDDEGVGEEGEAGVWEHGAKPAVWAAAGDLLDAGAGAVWPGGDEAGAGRVGGFEAAGRFDEDGGYLMGWGAGEMVF